jgi:hypothetical protein
VRGKAPMPRRSSTFVLRRLSCHRIRTVLSAGQGFAQQRPARGNTERVYESLAGTTRTHYQSYSRGSNLIPWERPNPAAFLMTCDSDCGKGPAAPQWARAGRRPQDHIRAAWPCPPRRGGRTRRLHGTTDAGFHVLGRATPLKHLSQCLNRSCGKLIIASPARRP